MKIVQSFALFDEGSPYLLKKRKKNKDYIPLNFYTFLLSYITLKYYYGSVTMFCNKTAYDSFIKYIPYDEIVIRENEIPFDFWNMYKINCMKEVGDDLIHVDSDVMIFNDFFRPFIDNDYDILVQNIVSAKHNGVKNFVFEQKDFYNETKIFTKSYDGRCFSCGTLGIKKNVQDYYFAGADIMYKAMLDLGAEKINAVPVVLEELLLYLIAVENEFRYYSILPDKLEIGNVVPVGDNMGYLHLWFWTKFKRNYIEQIRNKIFYNFPEYFHYLDKYEKEVLINNTVFNHMNFPAKIFL